MLWLTSFIDSGYFENEADSKKWMSTSGVVTLVGMMVCFPLMGNIVDRVSSHILSPISNAFRAFFILMFLFGVTEPNWLAIVMIVGMSLGTFFQSLSVYKLYLYELPKEVRGAMLGLFSVFGQLGALLFTMCAIPVALAYGPKATFGIVAATDLLCLALGLVLSCCGKLRT